MNIGFDAKRLFTNFTGLGNYSRTLVRHYHEAFTEDKLFLFTPRITEDERTLPFINDPAYHNITPNGFRPLWRTLDVVKDIAENNIDVYHGLSHELPLGLSKLDIGKVVTIHDLIFKYYSDDHSWTDRKIYNWKWKHASAVADIVIVISEQTKNDLIKYYNVSPAKIRVIYQPADPVFSKFIDAYAVSTVRKKYNLPKAYNLYVGSVISRKNLLSILQAMTLLKPSERQPLVIIGNGKRYKSKVIETAKAGGIENLLIWLGKTSFEDFPAIYKGAQMMIYPSFHEGFGLPVIEAMHVGIPVITSNQSSLKEAGGDAALLIDPNQPAEIAEAMKLIATDNILSKKMVDKGYQHIAKFDHTKMISQLRKVYEDVRR